jgi:hypothetical protein
VQNVWFAGVHADVGGGYAEAENGLAKVTLEWMLREATKAGLLVDKNMVAVLLGEQEGPGGAFTGPSQGKCRTGAVKLVNAMNRSWSKCRVATQTPADRYRTSMRTIGDPAPV